MSHLPSDPTVDEVTASRLLRLRLDLDDLRAENARLKGSIAGRQDEIVRLGEYEVELLNEIAALKRGLADMQAALRARTMPWWPVLAALRRLDAVRSRKP